MASADLRRSGAAPTPSQKAASDRLYVAAFAFCLLVALLSLAAAYLNLGR